MQPKPSKYRTQPEACSCGEAYPCSRKTGTKHSPLWWNPAAPRAVHPSRQLARAEQREANREAKRLARRARRSTRRS